MMNIEIIFLTWSLISSITLITIVVSYFEKKMLPLKPTLMLHKIRKTQDIFR